jgi:hypothetical protein
MRSESTRQKQRMPLKELERVMGIEPTLSAWEAEVLPLNYTREGFEL